MRNFVKLFLIFVIIASVISLNSCNSIEHEHIYATSWTTDAEFHWHDATCNHFNEVSDKGEHDYVNNVCSVCGYEKITEESSGEEDLSGGEQTQTELFAFTLINDESYVVTGVTDPTVETLDIPAVYNGLPVTEIDKSAFQNLVNVKTVVIP